MPSSPRRAAGSTFSATTPMGRSPSSRTPSSRGLSKQDSLSSRSARGPAMGSSSSSVEVDSSHAAPQARSAASPDWLDHMHVNVFDPQRFDVGLHTMAHPATVTPLAKLCQSLFGGLCPPRSGDGNQGFYRAALLSVQFGVHRNTLLRWQSFIVSVLAVVVSILVIVAKLATYGFEQFTDEVMGPTFITEITLYCVCAVASLAWAVVALIPPLYDTCIGAETTRLSAAKKTLVKNRISFKKRLLQRIVLNVFSSIWLGTVMGANLISKGGYSQTLVVIAALYSFFPVRVIDMHFLLLLSWFIYLVATLSVDREDVSEYWRYPKQLTRIVALGALAGVVAVDTHLRDFSMATKYILKRRFEAKKSKLEKDELRAKELLHNMLPPQVLRALEDGEPVEAEVYPSVTVIFIQLCDFESMSHGLRPADLVKILNVIFSRFDDIVKRHSVYKVETVGEVYMAVVGVPTRIQNHAQVAAACALDMLSSMRELQILIDKAKIKTRDNRLFDSSRVMVHIGMNSGPVNAGVVGLKSPRYKLFGDTVNTASRMESTCAPGEVQCSAATAEILQNSFYLVPRLVDVQGKGEMKTAIITGMMEERLELVQEATRSDSIAFVTFSQSKKRIGIVAPKPSPHFDPAEFVRRIYHYSALRRGEKDGGYTTEVSVLGTRQDRKRWLSPPLISHAARDRLRSWLERARELIQQQRLSGLYVSAEERVKQRLLMVGSGSDLSDERDALLGARDEIVSAVTCCETGCPARTRELLALVAKQIYFHARRFTYGLVDSDPKHIEQMDKLYTTFIDSHQARWMKGSRICTICYLIFICLIEWPYHWILNHDASVANMIAKESSGLPTLKHHMFIVHTFIGPTLTLFAFYTFVAENYYANHEAKGESAGPPLLSTKCNRIVAAVFSIVVAVEVLFIAEHNNRSGGILDDSFVMFFVIWNFHITITQLNIRILISAIALLLYAVKMWIMLGNVSSNFIGLVAFAIVSIVPMVISRHYSQYTFVQQDQIQNQAQQLAKIAEKSTRILRSVLPAKVARDPRLGKSLIADQFDQATVLFTDLKGFTQFSAELTPRQLVDFLNLLYSAFDEILDECGVYKVEIIGDAYYCVGGCPDRCEPQEHASAVIDAALAMLRILPRICDSHSLGNGNEMPPLQMRVGIHTGPVIAAVVGKTDPRYHLFGRTVSYAERMESSGTPGAVQISSATYELVRHVARYTFERRLESPTAAGGSSAAPTYFVTGQPAQRGSKRAEMRRLKAQQY